MPYYSVRAADGKYYSLEAPDGTTKDQALALVYAKAPAAATPSTQSPLGGRSPIEKAIGPLSAVTDVGLNVLQGVTGTTKSITDIFGANNPASQWLRSRSSDIQGLTSLGSRERAQRAAQIMQEAKDKGFLDQVLAGMHAITANPVDVLAQGAGSIIPMALGALAMSTGVGEAVGAVGAGAAGAAGAAALGEEALAATAAAAARSAATKQLAARVTGSALGVASGAGTIKGDIYDAVKQEMTSRGMAPDRVEQAAMQAQSYGSNNLGQIALGGIIGGIASGSGIEREIAENIAKKALTRMGARTAATETAEAAGKKVAKTGLLRSMVEEAVPEAVQAGQEQVAQNRALQRQGVDVPTFQGVLSNATLEGVVGGILGGALHATGHVNEENEDLKITSDKARRGLAIVAAVKEAAQNPTDETVDKIVAMFEAEGLSNAEAKTATATAIKTQANNAGAANANTGAFNPGGNKPVVSPVVGGGTAGRTTGVAAGVEPGGVDEFSSPPSPTDAEKGATGTTLKKKNVTATMQDIRQAFTADKKEAQPLWPDVKALTKEQVKAAATLVVDQGISHNDAIISVLSATKPTPAPVVEEAAPVVEEEQVAGGIPLTPETFVDRYVAGEGRGDTPADLELQQFQQNNPEAIATEFTKRAGAPVVEEPTPAPTVEEPTPAPAAEEAAPVVEEAAPVVEEEQVAEGFAPPQGGGRWYASDGSSIPATAAPTVEKKKKEPAPPPTIDQTLTEEKVAEEPAPAPVAEEAPPAVGTEAASEDTLSQQARATLTWARDKDTKLGLKSRSGYFVLFSPYAEKKHPSRVIEATPKNVEKHLASQQAKLDKAVAKAQALLKARKNRTGSDTKKRDHLRKQVQGAIRRLNVNEIAEVQDYHVEAAVDRLMAGTEETPSEALQTAYKTNAEPEADNKFVREEKEVLQQAVRLRKNVARIKAAAEDYDFADARRRRAAKNKLRLTPPPPTTVFLSKTPRIPIGGVATWELSNRNGTVEVRNVGTRQKGAYEYRDTRVSPDWVADGATNLDQFKERLPGLVMSRNRTRGAPVGPKGENLVGGVTETARNLTPSIHTLAKKAADELGLDARGAQLFGTGAIYEARGQKAPVDRIPANQRLLNLGRKWAKSKEKNIIEDLKAELAKARTNKAVDALVIDSHITPEEQEVLAEEFGKKDPETGKKVYNDEVRAKFKEVLIDIINGVKSSASAAVQAIANNIKAVVIALAIVFSPAALNSINIDTIQAIDTAVAQDITFTIPGDLKETMSPQAILVAEHMLPGAFAQGRGGTIIDKPTGRMYAFDKSGKPVLNAPVLLGKAVGDTLTPERLAAAINDLTAEQRVTPAGQFTLKMVDSTEYAGGKVFFLFNTKTNQFEGGVAIHSVYTGTPSERRIERLNSSTAADNRITYGCINTAFENIKTMIEHSEDFDGGLVFIVPDDASKTAEMFPAQNKETPKKETPGKAAGLGMAAIAIPGARKKKKGEKPEAEEPKAEEPKAEEPKAEEPKAEEPKATPKPAPKAAPKGTTTALKRQLSRLMVDQEENHKAVAKVQNAIDAQHGKQNDVQQFVMSMLNDGIGGSILAHDADSMGALLENNLTSIPADWLKTIVNAMPSSGLVGWVEKNLPSMAPPLKRLEKLTQMLTGEKSAKLREYSVLVDAVAAFEAKNGQQELASLAYLSRMTGVDTADISVWKPGATLDDIFKADPVMREAMGNLRAATTANDTAAITNADIAGKNRMADLTEVFKAHEKLGKQPGGQDLYRRIRKFYEDSLAERRALLDERMRKKNLNPELVEKTLAKVRQEEEGGAILGKNDRYPGVDIKTVPTAYISFNRFGDFWVRVKNSGFEGGEFHMFETARERDAWKAQRAAEMGVRPTNTDVFEFADTRDELIASMSSESAMFKRFLEVIEDAINTAATANQKLDKEFKDTLRSQLYQVWLLSTPERSLRRQFIAAKYTAGFSMDLLQGLRNDATRNANEITNIKFADDIETTVGEANKLSRGFSDQGRISTIISELSGRAKENLNPVKVSKLVDFANKAGFIYYLTGAATAITQLTGIPIRVMPRLVRKYGYARATAMLFKYGNLLETTGFHESAGGVDKFVGPTLASSKALKGDPRLARAFDELQRRAVFEGFNTAVLRNQRTPTSSAQRVTGQITEASMRVATALFTTAENYSRQMTAMMAYELSFAKNIKAGMNEEAAHTKAVDDAVDDTNGTLGNYNEFERPGLMRGDVGRSLFLFKMYSVLTTKFFVNNLHSMYAPQMKAAKAAVAAAKQSGTPAALELAEKRLAELQKERGDAFHETAGVLLMGSLFHGIVGMPMFGLICAAIDLALKGDKDDEEERRRRNPYTADSASARFMYEYLPSHFGAPTIQGADGRLHSLANVLRYGPMSELTDLNIGSRTSFNGLWFREPMPTTDTPNMITEVMASNIPFISMVRNLGRAADNFNDGEVTRGLENLAPAFFRGLPTTYRLATQGAEVRRGDKLVTRDEINNLDLVGQLFGFQPTQIADMQKRRNTVNNSINQIKTKRAELMQDFNKAVTDPEGDPQTVRKTIQEIQKWNAEYPVPYIQIESDDLDSSFRSFTQNSNMVIRGTLADKNNIIYVLRTLGILPPPE